MVRAVADAFEKLGTGTAFAAWARCHRPAQSRLPVHAVCTVHNTALPTSRIFYELDSVILLPLMALASSASPGRPPVAALGSLALGILTDYYIGYMLCIFSRFVFSVLYLGGCRARGALCPCWPPVAGASLLAAGLPPCVLLPALASCRGNRKLRVRRAAGHLPGKAEVQPARPAGRKTLGAYAWRESWKWACRPFTVASLALVGAGMFFSAKSARCQKVPAPPQGLAAVFVLSFWLGGQTSSGMASARPRGSITATPFCSSFLCWCWLPSRWSICGAMGQSHLAVKPAAPPCVLALVWACLGAGAQAFTTAKRAAISLVLAAAVGLLSGACLRRGRRPQGAVPYHGRVVRPTLR